MGEQLTSGLATVQRKTQPQRKENERPSSPNITLTFFPLFHKNALDEKTCISCPRERTLWTSSKSQCLEVFDLFNDAY